MRTSSWDTSPSYATGQPRGSCGKNTSFLGEILMWNTWRWCRTDRTTLPGLPEELWTAEFQENNALLLGKEDEAEIPGKHRRFFDFWRSKQRWELAPKPFVMVISEVDSAFCGRPSGSGKIRVCYRTSAFLLGKNQRFPWPFWIANCDICQRYLVIPLVGSGRPRPCSTRFANVRKFPMPCWVQHSEWAKIYEHLMDFRWFMGMVEKLRKKNRGFFRFRGFLREFCFRPILGKADLAGNRFISVARGAQTISKLVYNQLNCMVYVLNSYRLQNNKEADSS